MPDNKNLQNLHSNLPKYFEGFNVPYETFVQEMQDENKLKSLHSNLLNKVNGFNVPYDKFKSDMGFLPQAPAGIPVVNQSTLENIPDNQPLLIKGKPAKINPSLAEEQNTGNFIGDVGQRIAAGVLKLPDSAMKGLEFVNALVNQGVSKVTGIPKEQIEVTRNAMSNYGLGLASDFDPLRETKAFKANEQAVEKLREKSDRYQGQTITELWKQDKGKAVGAALLSGAESLPQSLLAAFAGPAGLSSLGVMAAGEQYDSLSDRTDMSEGAKLINSTLNGGFEILTEYFGSKQFGDLVKNLYKQGGKELVQEAVKNTTKNFYKEAFKKYGLYFAPVGEGVEELGNQIASNVTAVVTGEDTNRKLFDGAWDAFGSGAGGGTFFTAMGVPADIANKIKPKKVIDQALGESNLWVETPIQKERREKAGKVNIGIDVNDNIFEVVGKTPDGKLFGYTPKGEKVIVNPEEVKDDISLPVEEFNNIINQRNQEEPFKKMLQKEAVRNSEIQKIDKHLSEVTHENGEVIKVIANGKEYYLKSGDIDNAQSGDMLIGVNAETKQPTPIDISQISNTERMLASDMRTQMIFDALGSIEVADQQIRENPAEQVKGKEVIINGKKGVITDVTDTENNVGVQYEDGTSEFLTPDQYQNISTVAEKATTQQEERVLTLDEKTQLKAVKNPDGTFTVGDVINDEKQANKLVKQLNSRFAKSEFMLVNDAETSDDPFSVNQYRIISKPKNAVQETKQAEQEGVTQEVQQSQEVRQEGSEEGGVTSQISPKLETEDYTQSGINQTETGEIIPEGVQESLSQKDFRTPQLLSDKDLTERTLAKETNVRSAEQLKKKLDSINQELEYRQSPEFKEMRNKRVELEKRGYRSAEEIMTEDQVNEALEEGSEKRFVDNALKSLLQPFSVYDVSMFVPRNQVEEATQNIKDYLENGKELNPVNKELANYLEGSYKRRILLNHGVNIDALDEDIKINNINEAYILTPELISDVIAEYAEEEFASIDDLRNILTSEELFKLENDVKRINEGTKDYQGQGETSLIDNGKRSQERETEPIQTEEPNRAAQEVNQTTGNETLPQESISPTQETTVGEIPVEQPTQEVQPEERPVFTGENVTNPYEESNVDYIEEQFKPVMKDSEVRNEYLRADLELELSKLDIPPVAENELRSRFALEKNNGTQLANWQKNKVDEAEKAIRKKLSKKYPELKSQVKDTKDLTNEPEFVGEAISTIPQKTPKNDTNLKKELKKEKKKNLATQKVIDGINDRVKEIDKKLKDLRSKRESKKRELEGMKTTQTDLFVGEAIQKDKLFDVKADYSRENIVKALQDFDGEIKKLQDERVKLFETKEQVVKEASGQKDLIPERPDTEGEMLDQWVLDYSTDPQEIYASWLSQKETAPLQKLSLIEEKVLGRRVNRQSFKDFSDKNNIDGGLALAWFTKKGEGTNSNDIDVIAQEISEETGKTVTPDEVVDIMLKFRTGEPRKTTDLQNDLAAKYKLITGQNINTVTNETLEFDESTPFKVKDITKTENFKKWFGNSKVVDNEGNPLVVYSGHGNIELYGNKFDPKKGTAGGFYASESPEVASGYALSKFGSKEGYENGNQYRLKGKNGQFNKKLWQIELTEEQKKKFDEITQRKNEYDESVFGVSNMMSWARDNKNYDPLARRILYQPYNLQNIWAFNEMMGYNIAYPEQRTDKNEPAFLLQNKNQTEQILDELGIEWSAYDWMVPGIMPVYLSIKNPLDADNPFPKDLLDALKERAKGEREKSYQEIHATTWTKDYPLKQFIKDIESGEDSWTTQVPKKALEVFKRFGYDGIKERGMKGQDVPREQKWINWIAFEPTQIKSATGNKGTFDPNNPDMAFKVKPLYSNTEKALQSIKQEKATPEQWKAMLLKNGSKEAELTWMGFDDFVKDKKSLTKNDLTEFVNSNKVDVQEVVKGEVRSRDLKKVKTEPFVFKVVDDKGEVLLENVSEQRAIDFIENYENGTDTKYSQYVLPGGKNYKELLLTMPVKKVFDKSKVEIKRHISSATQGTTEIIYDGKVLGDFSDDPKLTDGEYKQKPDSYWINYAEKAINFGDNYNKIQSDANFKSGHFDEPNILAHVRFDERVDKDGNNVLFIQEFQSDWAQAGRKSGFKQDDSKIKLEPLLTKEEIEITETEHQYAAEVRGTFRYVGKGTVSNPEAAKEYFINWLNKDIEAKNERIKSDNRYAIPNMPFKSTDQWLGLAFKRMVQYAAENGFDKIAWTTGEQQAERYDLSKQVDYIKKSPNAFDENLSYVDISTTNGIFNLSVNKSGEIVNQSGTTTLGQLIGKNLSDVIGKDITAKILESPQNTTLQGEGLKVGGEGMKAFYDQIVPSYANKFGKKFGAKVEETKIPADDVSNIQIFESIDKSKWIVEYEKWDGWTSQKSFNTKEEANKFAGSLPTNGTTVQSLPLTDELAETALQGFPMFNRKNPTEPSILGEYFDYAEQKKEFNAEVAFIANEYSQRLNTKVNVIQNESQLPDAIQKNMQKKGYKKGTVPGVFNPESNEVFLMTDNLEDTHEARTTVLHEVVGHKGLRGLLGNEFKPVLMDIYESMSQEDINRIAELYGTKNPLIIADEYLAEMAEKDVKPNFIQRAISRIKALLRKLFNIKYSDNDIKDLLVRSKEYLEKNRENIKGEEASFKVMGTKGVSNSVEADIRLNNLTIARDMEKTKDPLEIKMATGWERGADGKWRYETPDFEVKKSFDEMYNTIENGISKEIPLNEVIEDKELFESYPELKNIKIVFYEESGATSGFIDTKKQVILINFSGQETQGEVRGRSINRTQFGRIGGILPNRANDITSFKSLLSHEIQHYIQRFEGFEFGGNRDSVWGNLIENKLLEYKKDNRYQNLGEERQRQNAELDVRNQFGTKEKAYQSLAGEVEARNVQRRISFTEEQRKNILLEETEDVSRKDQAFLENAYKVNPITKTKAFRDWFGDSKVVDENGVPLVVYHGTDMDFNEFSNKSKQRSAGTKGGVWFTDNSSLAESYTEFGNYNKEAYERALKYGDIYGNSIGNSSIMPVYLSIKNPLIIDAKGQKSGNINGKTISDLFNDAINDGNDGIIINNVEDSGNFKNIIGNVYVVFSPTQIKSATGNIGTFDPNNPDIRFKVKPETDPVPIINQEARKALEKVNKRTIREHLNEFRQIIQDRKLPIRDLEKEVVKRGGKQDDNSKPYRDSFNAFGRIESLWEDFREEKMKPVYKFMAKYKKSGLTMKDFIYYMIAKHSSERNKQIRINKVDEWKKKHPKATDQEVLDYYNTLKNKDFSGVMAIDINKEFTGEGKEFYNDPEGYAKSLIGFVEQKIDVDRFWKLMNKATGFILERQLKAKIFNEEQYKIYKEGYKHYVPLRGWFDAVDKELDYHSGSGIGKSMKKAEGRSSLPDNPLVYIEEMAFRSIGEQVTNEVNESMLALILNNYKDNRDLFSVKKIYFKKNKDGEFEPTTNRPTQEEFDLGLAKTELYGEHEKLRTAAEADEHEVMVNTDNGTYAMIFHDVEVSQSMNNQNNLVRVFWADKPLNTKYFNDNFVVSPIHRMTSIMKGLQTSWNVVFPLTNFFRDFPEAVTYMYVTGGAKQSAKMAQSVFKDSIGTVSTFVFNRSKFNPEKNKKHRLYQEAREDGAFTGFTHARNIDQISESIEREIRKSMRDVDMGKILDAIKNYNRIFEDSVRFAAYVTSRESGLSRKESAAVAKQASVNFNANGKLTKTFDAFYAYFNVSVQSAQKNLKIAKDYPKRFAIASAAWATLGLLMAELNRFVDDDDEYEQVNEWVRQNYMVIPLGGTYLRIPLPQFFRAFYSVGTLVSDVAHGKKTVGKAAANVGVNMASSLSPIDPGGFRVDGEWSIGPLIPTFYKPKYEKDVNRNFVGAAVYKEAFTKELEKTLAASQMYKPNVNPAIRFFTDATFEAFGGIIESGKKTFTDENGIIKEVPWGADINPSIVEHYIRGYGAGTASTIINLYTTLNNMFMPDKAVSKETIPLINTFLKEYPEKKWKIMDNYYNLKDNLEKHVTYMKGIKDNDKLLNDMATNKVMININSMVAPLEQNLKYLKNQYDANELTFDEYTNKRHDEIVKKMESFDKIRTGLIRDYKEQLDAAKRSGNRALAKKIQNDIDILTY